MHMKKQGKCNGNPYSRSPVLLVALNFFLGILLTYFFLTNVEWNGTVANIIFPIVVFIVARISCSYSKRKYEKNKRRLISIACIPSYFSSILYFVYYLFFLTVGFMALMFLISEEQNKVKIQTVYSPDKSYYCDVYFTPTGAYASGSGKLFIYCVNTNFPLVRKHLYTEAPSYFPIGDVSIPYEFMQWKNDRVISIGPQLEIDVSKTKVYIYYFIKNSSPWHHRTNYHQSFRKQEYGDAINFSGTQAGGTMMRNHPIIFGKKSSEYMHNARGGFFTIWNALRIS